MDGSRLRSHDVPEVQPPHPLVVALQPLIDVSGAHVVAVEDMSSADIALEWGGEPVAGVKLPPLHGSMERLIALVQIELGAPLPELTRVDKQRAISRLDELGAFVLRRAVEDIAEAMEISRITVYSYLNALHR